MKPKQPTINIILLAFQEHEKSCQVEAKLVQGKATMFKVTALKNGKCKVEEVREKKHKDAN